MEGEGGEIGWSKKSETTSSSSSSSSSWTRCRKFSRRDCMRRSGRRERRKEGKKGGREGGKIIDIGAADVPLATVKCYSNVTAGRGESLRTLKEWGSRWKEKWNEMLGWIRAFYLRSTMIVLCVTRLWNQSSFNLKRDDFDSVRGMINWMINWSNRCSCS